MYLQNSLGILSHLDDKCVVILINIVYHYQTVALLSHFISLFPDLPCSYLPFAFTIIHGSGLLFLCILTCEHKWKAKMGEAWERC